MREVDQAVQRVRIIDQLVSDVQKAHIKLFKLTDDQIVFIIKINTVDRNAGFLTDIGN